MVVKVSCRGCMSISNNAFAWQVPRGFYSEGHVAQGKSSQKSGFNGYICMFCVYQP